MIDLGDPILLTVTCTDLVTGALVNALPSLTITKPDGSTTVVPSGTPANPSTGVYTYAYTPAVAGRFAYYWQAIPGVSTSAYDGSFLVVQPGNMLISLEEARAGLRVPAGVIVNDEDLRSLIAAAVAPMEDLCGPILRRACDEWHDGGRETIRLLQAPVIDVLTVVEAYGAGSTHILSEQVLDGGGSFDAYGYTADLDEGLVFRRYSGQSGPFIGGRRNIHVTYIAGRLVMPANLQRATRRLIRWLWQTEMQGQRPNGSKPEQVAYTDSGYPVPTAGVGLCASEKRIVGIA